MVNIGGTLGALLVGGIIAAAFSGMVTVQTFAYFKSYSCDAASIKTLVVAVWLLDILHTVFVSMSLWDHLIEHFGDVSRIEFVPWSLASTIALTAIITFLVHCFFVHRIYKLSEDNYFIAIPLGAIACLRLGFACLTTVKLITLKNLHTFVAQYRYSFTSGLVLSSVMDVLITGFLCFFLMVGKKKNANASINHILDSLMLYAFENGALTCAATILSLIFWLVMPHNFVFMALHFVISKFYANSLLATLNTRKSLNLGYQSSRSVSNSNAGSRGLPVYFPDSRNPCHRGSKRISHMDDPTNSGHVLIKVETTIQTMGSSKNSDLTV